MIVVIKWKMTEIDINKIFQITEKNFSFFINFWFKIKLYLVKRKNRKNLRHYLNSSKVNTDVVDDDVEILWIKILSISYSHPLFIHSWNRQSTNVKSHIIHWISSHILWWRYDEVIKEERMKEELKGWKIKEKSWAACSS